MATEITNLSLYKHHLHPLHLQIVRKTCQGTTTLATPSVTHIKVVHFEAVNPERNGFGVEDCSETLAGNAALRFRASDGAADVAIVGIEGGAVRHQVAETVDKNVGEML